MAEKMNYCRQCGAQIAEGEKFCSYCDCRIEAENTGGNQRKRNRFAAVERLTLRQQLRSCSAMNTAVHTAATQQRLVGSVEDSIHPHFVMSFLTI